MAETTYEGWVAVFSTGHDYEADLVRARLDNAEVDAVVLTQRDHAFNLTGGDLAKVYVMVPPEQVEAARAVLADEPFSDDELDDAALSADPDAPDAHDPKRQTMLDSGADSIRLSTPDPADDATS